MTFENFARRRLVLLALCRRPQGLNRRTTIISLEEEKLKEEEEEEETEGEELGSHES